MKKALLWIGTGLLILSGGFFATYKILEAHVNTFPENSVRACDGSAGASRVLVLGDSITHGRVSANYVERLRAKYGERYDIVNGGINGHLTHDLRLRLPDALDKCRPDIVLVMIGTNDVNIAISKQNRERYRRAHPEARLPDRDWFTKNLRDILVRLTADAAIERVALYSIPPIGETIDSPENRLVAEYNSELKRIAAEFGVPVLPLFERMHAELSGRTPPDLCGSDRYYVEAAVFQYYLLGRTWNEISDTFNMQFTTDCLHFNERGAELMADLAAPVLELPGDESPGFKRERTPFRISRAGVRER
jgi:lysophospholipase L1-like esterase